MTIQNQIKHSQQTNSVNNDVIENNENQTIGIKQQ